jgi:hypothetical protein
LPRLTVGCNLSSLKLWEGVMVMGVRAAALALPLVMFAPQAEAWWDAGHMTVAAASLRS